MGCPSSERQTNSGGLGIEGKLDLLIGPGLAESVAAGPQGELATRRRHLAQPALLRQVAIHPVQIQEFLVVFGLLRPP